MSKTYSGIDVMACVQGNTARSFDSFEGCNAYDTGLDHCVVYDFNTRSAAADRVNSENTSRKRRAQARKKAARARARKVRLIRTVLFAFLVMTTMFGIGGIASRAKSKAVPKAYKYYDTITVQYQENMLDIVQRYDDRNYYKTQKDYLEELCMINNLKYDENSYPEVTPGTHLVVPYFSTELK